MHANSEGHRPDVQEIVKLTRDAYREYTSVPRESVSAALAHADRLEMARQAWPLTRPDEFLTGLMPDHTGNLLHHAVIIPPHWTETGAEEIDALCGDFVYLERFAGSYTKFTIHGLDRAHFCELCVMSWLIMRQGTLTPTLRTTPRALTPTPPARTVRALPPAAGG